MKRKLLILCSIIQAFIVAGQNRKIMKTKLFFLCKVVFSLSTPVAVNSQDTIMRKNGDIVLCKILKEDSTTVSFILKRNGKEIKTFLNKSDIQSFKYGVLREKAPIFIDKASFGIGLGLDLGGVGANLVIYPQKNLGLFVGLGSVVGLDIPNPYSVGTGFNAGVKIRMISNKARSMITPFIMAMYGYNTAIHATVGHGFDIFSVDEEYKKLFYGPTIGIGLDFRLNPARNSCLTIALLIPIRNNSDINRYIEDLNTNHNVGYIKFFPLAKISISYRCILF